MYELHMLWFYIHSLHIYCAFSAYILIRCLCVALYNLRQNRTDISSERFNKSINTMTPTLKLCAFCCNYMCS